LVVGHACAVVGKEFPADAPSVHQQGRRPAREIDAGRVEIENLAAVVGGVDRSRKSVEIAQRPGSTIAQNRRGAADQRFGGVMARLIGLPGLDGSDGFAPLPISRRYAAPIVTG
jgi:hypothetical protein